MYFRKSPRARLSEFFSISSRRRISGWKAGLILSPGGDSSLAGNERHEAYWQHVALVVSAVGAPGDELQILDVAAADRDHHPAARLQLLDQRLQHARRGSRDHDAVERRLLRPAAVAVADLDLDVPIPELGKARGGGFAEAVDQFDAVDLLHDLGENRRLISRTGADIEHDAVGIHFQKIC